MSSPSLRRRRWVRAFLLTLGGGLALFLGFVAWALLFCFAEPPEVAAASPALAWRPTTDPDGRVHLGPSWFQEQEGRSLLYLEGGPFEIGFANATLTSAFLEFQERSLIETVEEHFPSPLVRFGLALAVLVNNRNLQDYVTDEYRLEILGLSQGRETDPYPYLGPRYHRILNYHAAHDISHWVWDRPVLGCSAFAARGSATRTGELLIGRNFDWEAGAHFDRNKTIVLCRPARGHAFLSVSWPGMAGAVTGMNDERIYCSVNGAHSERRANIGRPVSLVVREVLQYASDLPQALEIVRAAEVFVADSYLLADGETGEAVVVEKAPGLAAVRGMERDLLIQANHFETAEFSEDQGNRDYMRAGTSIARRARLAELLAQRRGALDPPAAVEILRDHRGPGGAERGLGHRATINPMIATHSVVAQVTEGILWVSRGPHQLGAYDAYRLRDFGAPFTPAIEPDADLLEVRYARLEEARALLGPLVPRIEAGDALDARQWRDLERAHELEPLDPSVLVLLARAKERAGEAQVAVGYYEAALAASIPFPSQEAEVRTALAHLRAARP